MKRISLGVACLALTICLSISCIHIHRHEVKLTLSENEDRYSITAHFPDSKTSRIDHYLSEHLNWGGASFHNTEMDADLTMEDGTRLYMKKYPGFLHIVFDKDQNSRAAYRRIKSLGEGLRGEY